MIQRYLSVVLPAQAIAAFATGQACIESQHQARLFGQAIECLAQFAGRNLETAQGAAAFFSEGGRHDQQRHGGKGNRHGQGQWVQGTSKARHGKSCVMEVLLTMTGTQENRARMRAVFI